MSNFTDKAKSVIGSLAPMVGTALGGPFGGMAGALLAKWLGKEGQPADTKAIEEAIAFGNPDVLLKIKQAENEFIEHMKALNIQEDQLRFADTANAREREIKTGDSWTPRILAAFVVIGWLAVQYFLLHNVVDQSMRELVARVLGTLDGALMLVLSYYFGSSASSHNKDETLASIAKS